MRVLLDTHVFVWAVMDDARLSRTARDLMEGAGEIYVSAASIWEIAIKARLGKIEADPRDMQWAIGASGFIELPVTVQHAVEVARLPLLQGHKDPFDRLLVAQSVAEPLVLLTADAGIAQYGGLVRTV